MDMVEEKRELVTSSGDRYQYHQLPGTHTPPDMSVNLDQPTVKQRCRDLLTKLCSRHVLKLIAMGQLLSLLICGTGVTSGLLQQQGVQTPTAQSFLNYVLLCLVFTVVLACRQEERNLVFLLKTYWWKYLILAVIDVEANYLVVKAFKFTTVTSVQLLDCFSIPTVMLLSYFVLRVRYRLVHLVGVVCCLLGLGGLVAADVLAGRNNGGGTTGASNPLLGDFLVIAGAALYGMSNVGEEYVIKHFARTEFLGMLGLFGSFISGIQFVILERHEVSNLDFTRYEIVLPWLGFVLCQFLIYSCMTIVIQYTSATSVNLSILSADFYSMLFGLFLFHYKFHVLYFLAFVLVIMGISIYSMKETETR
ncbi:solute carrier family 35 member F1-like [Haliotis asinina]|uniref:solute carrier family 35 member F1-like n=1 Tax=Haliotis asinina TaxID=109174 RepID=UPI0035318312